MHVIGPLFHRFFGEGKLAGDRLCLKIDQQRQLVVGHILRQKAHQNLGPIIYLGIIHNIT